MRVWRNLRIFLECGPSVTGGWWSLGHHYIHQRQTGGGFEMGGGRGSYKGDSRVDVVIGDRMLENLKKVRTFDKMLKKAI